jgi:acyl-CoA thioester hydrolase
MNNKKHVHTTSMPIRWGDMDALGHVNNTVYFRYMEQARIEWLLQIGCVPDLEGEGVVIINAQCTFLRQLKYPGMIEIHMFIGEIGRSSFETIYEIRRIDDSEILIAEGRAKVVWVNFASEKSVPLPEAIKQRFIGNGA